MRFRSPIVMRRPFLATGRVTVSLKAFSASLNHREATLVEGEPHANGHAFLAWLMKAVIASIPSLIILKPSGCKHTAYQEIGRLVSSDTGVLVWIRGARILRIPSRVLNGSPGPILSEISQRTVTNQPRRLIDLLRSGDRHW